MTEAIEALRQALNEAQTVVALTGAGVSAESGIPTFRGPNGLWRNYSPEKLATIEAFERDPKLVWEWYDWRRGLIRKAGPNAGHRALRELDRRKSGEASGGRQTGRVPVGQSNFTLVTQNVDGLHDRAGSVNILKLHGDIWTVRCTGCGTVDRNDQVPLDPLPPRCRCGALLRPGVVWFGEPLPVEEWEQALSASQSAHVFLVIGTSAIVYPAAGLAQVARAGGARLAVINPEPTPLDAMADWVLRGPSGDILGRLL